MNKCCLGVSIPYYGHSRNCLGSKGYYDETKNTVVIKDDNYYIQVARDTHGTVVRDNSKAELIHIGKSIDNGDE